MTPMQKYVRTMDELTLGGPIRTARELMRFKRGTYVSPLDGPPHGFTPFYVEHGRRNVPAFRVLFEVPNGDGTLSLVLEDRLDYRWYVEAGSAQRFLVIRH